jgi:hypothetical protein
MVDLPDLGAFGAAFEQFVHAMSLAAEHKESEVTVRLREHLGADPKELPTTGTEFPLTEHANLQLAIDAVLSDAEIVGFTTRHPGFGSVGLAEIVAGQGMTGPISFGPVQYTDVEVGDGRVIQCIAGALLLTAHQGRAVALVLSRGGDHPMAPSSLKLEGISPEHGVVSLLLREVRAAMREHNVFRGRIISLHQHGRHQETVRVQFHSVPTVEREGVILPDGTLERLERHTLEMTRMAGRLRSAGQHLKRGVLLHGPPGTGKTLTVMYLLHAMAGRTILLTGRGLGLIEQALAIGRELAPATIVFRTLTWSRPSARCRSTATEGCCLSCSTRWRVWPRTRTCCSVDHQPTRSARARASGAPGTHRPGAGDPTARR